MPEQEAELPALEIRDLARNGLGPLNLQVSAGQCVCLTGASGTGKTLLLRAIVDLDEHDGDVLLRDTTAREVSPSRWRRWVGMLPAEPAWWYDTVRQHFSGDINKEMMAALGLLEGQLDRPISQLSTGERQRWALLRLLQNRPDVLLLDEPTAALDRENTARVEQVVLDYIAQHDAGVLWVTHEEAQIERLHASHYRLQHGLLEKQ